MPTVSGTPLEIDVKATFVEPVNKEASTDNSKGQGDGKHRPPDSHEIEIRIYENMQHLKVANPSLKLAYIEYCSSHEKRGKETDDKPKCKADAEPTKLIVANHIENDCGENTTHMSVNNCGESAVITVSKSKENTSSFFPFFTKAFVNKNVCIDRHTESKHQASKARQGEGCFNNNHECDGKKQV